MNKITKRQAKAVTVWLGLATTVVVLLQALIQLMQMFIHH